MKPRYAVVVFLFFAISSALTGMKSYQDTRDVVDADLQQALLVTLAAQDHCVITPDTIRNYRASLSIGELRDTAYLAYTLQGEIQAKCSTAAVFRLSDQRLSTLFAFLAACWAIASLWWYRRKTLASCSPLPVEGQDASFGGLRYDEDARHFYDQQNNLVHLTPMQHHLLTMFFLSPSHELSHREITEALWPKKPDASETLYTLIRRLKVVLAQHSSLTVTVDRGRSYSLTLG
ncbi:MAG: helix-turn-helix domain-containing protein [Prevotella sp.]|nr:helix-turn-helix domain-containing protein [Prevotella sp.]